MGAAEAVLRLVYGRHQPTDEVQVSGAVTLTDLKALFPGFWLTRSPASAPPRVPIPHHGPDAILAAVARLAPELHAQVTVSTAHKAKGREWACVLIADDFARSNDSTADEQTNAMRPPDPIDDAEARLAYVAVTRTRQRLDLGGLSWIHDHPDGTL